VTAVEIPNRSVFRAAEVCELVSVQPYVLRSWEAEFPDLGVAKSAGAPRVYRRADVEKVLRLKHLILVDGLTLAGARKRLSEEGVVAAPVEEVSDSDVANMMDAAMRDGLRDLKRGLQWVLGVLGGEGANNEFALRAQPASGPERARSVAAKRPAPKPVAKKKAGKSKK
jgi:DNA-binding transcriptional MerR regulator